MPRSSIGESVALHRGRTTMVWQTSIRSAEGRLCAVVTQTQLVLDGAPVQELRAAADRGEAVIAQHQARGRAGQRLHRARRQTAQPCLEDLLLQHAERVDQRAGHLTGVGALGLTRELALKGCTGLRCQPHHEGSEVVVHRTCPPVQ